LGFQSGAVQTSVLDGYDTVSMGNISPMFIKKQCTDGLKVREFYILEDKGTVYLLNVGK
jgi:hypothetical protein